MSGASAPPPPPPPPPGIPNGASHPAGPPPVGRWYWQTWVVVLALILLFPLGLVLLWTRKPEWSLRARWITSAAVVALVIVAVATAPPRSASTGPATQSPPAVGGDAPSATAAVTPVATAAPSATPLSTPTPTPTPTLAPTPAPTPVPIAAPTAAPTAAPVNLCGAPPNPWSYNFCGGGLIYSPDPSFCSYFKCIPSFWESTSGYVDQCNDGDFSHSGGRSGACSYHDGEERPLYS